MDGSRAHLAERTRCLVTSVASASLMSRLRDLSDASGLASPIHKSRSSVTLSSLVPANARQTDFTVGLWLYISR